MNTAPTLDPEFAKAVRAELLATGAGQSSMQRRQRRARFAGVGVAVIALAGVTTGAAVVVNLPGLTTVVPARSAVTATRTGTATIDLGTDASGANSVVIDLSCVSGAGKVSVPTTAGSDGAPETTGFDCSTVHRTVHIDDGLLSPRGRTITISADPGTTWKVTARYATTRTTAWGVNADGRTYGVANKQNGVPDLVAAQAANGAVGYIFSKELFGPDAHKGGSINVYESDGKTVIGKFPFSGGTVSGSR